MNHKDVTDGFGRVLQELSDLQAAKVQEYGIKRYLESDERRAMMMIYNDVYRKFIRFEHQTFDFLMDNDGRPDLPAIRESCRDMANYSAMGVQMVDLLQPAEAFMAAVLEDAQRPQARETGHHPALADIAIEQIALVGNEETVKALSYIIGPGAEWHHDQVTTRAMVNRNGPLEQVADLWFNYQLIPGKELEIIQYQEGFRSFHSLQGLSRGYLSHMGLHVDDIEKATARLSDAVSGEMVPVQDAVTLSHTNPAIKDTRRYRYRIFSTRKWLGFDLKFIERRVVNPGDMGVTWGPDSWLYVPIGAL